MSYVMPPEWAPHERTWMAFPTAGPSNDDLDAAGVRELQDAWAAVAAAILRFEPVSMVVDPSDIETARELLDERVDVVEIPLDDSWMRDIGPTFVHDADGSVSAVDWVFNGWGGQDWASWGKDSLIGEEVPRRAGIPLVSSALTHEGGGLHVDGEGAVLLTETVQLDPGRNPGWTKEQVEDELRRTLGVDRFVWVRRGLARDYEPFGTRGHIDVVAAFAPGGVVLVHDQRNREHPDHEVTAEVRALLEAEGSWRVVELPAPDTVRDDKGWVDYSYVNHYVVNGGVILCGFGDPGDERAAAVMREVYPDREVVLVDARPLFARGGGVHCITQQQPRPRH
ncbi:MAG TPA: agmatine deiminase family protein [Candidatus Nanopelagicales bacterium]|nr:agmatine deiminase family protein [Candidatus Nanopelagicales bacterium]